MNISSYKVGQVLYVVFHKENKIVPVLVTEEITKKTMSGVETTYSVQMGADQKQSFMLKDVEGEIFESSDLAKQSLVNRLTNAIEKLVLVAEKRAEEWYGSKGVQCKDQPDIEQILDTVPQPKTLTKVRVMLPDGTIANVAMPNNFDQ